MNKSQIKAIQRNRYTVSVTHPDTDEARTLAFATDAKAMEFMERASHQGFEITKCEGPS